MEQPQQNSENQDVKVFSQEEVDRLAAERGIEINRPIKPEHQDVKILTADEIKEALENEKRKKYLRREVKES